MNFRTESLDFPQNEQRRCLSCDMTDHSTGNAVAQEADIQRISSWEERDPDRGGIERIKGLSPVKQETTDSAERLQRAIGYRVRASGLRAHRAVTRWPEAD